MAVNIIFLGILYAGCGYEKQQAFGGRKLSVLSSTAISACVGCGAIFVAVLAFAYVITKIDATDLMLSVMSTAALGIGAYAGDMSAEKGNVETVCCQVCCAECSFFLSLSFSAHCFQKQPKAFQYLQSLCLPLCVQA